MENLYLIIVIVLFALAASDLIVGVSNDAVNFLNSAIGAKAAPLRIVLLIAALGVLFGATFSSGMMEVARKGIFNPGTFYFDEIMIIFLAVMLTDVLLLDLFNTFGLPTSTTVSIVFELLGAAVGIALLKIIGDTDAVGNLAHYINSATAVKIVIGIFLSVFIAFTVGAIIQYLTRLLFSFNYSKTMKYFGAVWGGLAICGITYFILLKGANGASFMTPETAEWIKHNNLKILLFSFLGWSILLQILQGLFKLNIPRFIVLISTFSLAMAFAGNDLVNFIGVPLAGFESFKTFMASNANPEAFTMEALAKPVKTNTLYLLIAGLIMVITLWLSKKSRSVVQTTINLSDQAAGNERFKSSVIARLMVRFALFINKLFIKITPKSTLEKMNKRMDPTYFSEKTKKETGVAFDMIRASVNLVTASMLIAFGTSLKLPLSTTYVTFMVAMGTSLADGAWARESAVYRITGVVTVIVGWLFTALIAFSAAFIMAIIIKTVGLISIVFLVLLALFLLYRTQIIHKKRAEKETKASLNVASKLSLDHENIYETCSNNIVSNLLSVSKLYSNTVDGLMKERRRLLKTQLKEIKKLEEDNFFNKTNIPETIKQLSEEAFESGDYYVELIEDIDVLLHSCRRVIEPSFNHIDNNHAPLSDKQQENLKELQYLLHDYLDSIIQSISNSNYKYPIDKVSEEIIKKVYADRKSQIKYIKKGTVSSRTNLLYLDLLNETKNLSVYGRNIFIAFKEFAERNNMNTVAGS